MKPWISTTMALAMVLATLGRGSAAAAPEAPDEAPRLVLLVAVDQMRYDYLPRFAAAFTGGFRRLARDGAGRKGSPSRFSSTAPGTCGFTATICLSPWPGRTRSGR
jgi:hypothetical protein